MSSLVALDFPFRFDIFIVKRNDYYEINFDVSNMDT